MKYIKADLKRPIPIGRQGENGVTTVQFPVRVFFPDMEEATYTLVHSREGDNVPYFCATVLNEDMLEWLILKADVDKPGAGVLQLTASSEEDKIGKSIILTTQTESSLGEAGDAPEAMESWLANMEALAVRAERGAADAATSQAAAGGSATAAAESAEAAREYEAAAETAVSHYPKIENNTWWVWDPVTGAYVDTGVSAEGYVGEDGFSPAVTISTITGGHNVNITDKDHPSGQDFDVMDGATGPQGPTGIEVSATQPTNPNIDVWFQEQQQGTPVEVYTVPEIDGMIAPAETSPTQAAHHVGEYIICVLNGQAKLYKVIAEISIQETLTPGGNIEVATVGDKLTGISHLHWGGNCMGLARNDGRVNITLPYQGDYTHVEVNTTQLTPASIYGSKGAVECTFELQNLGFSDAKAIYFNLQPSVTLSTYTDLAKQVLIFVSQEIVFTLS